MIFMSYGEGSGEILLSIRLASLENKKGAELAPSLE
jgi:hypothetical protein